MADIDRKYIQANKRLGELLRMERSDEEQSEVDRILAENKDLYARVTLIEELDRKSRRRFSDEDLPGKPETKRRPRPQAQPSGGANRTDRGGGGGLLSFFFGNRKALNDFAAKTGAVKPRLFGTQFELSSEAILLFKKIHNNEIAINYKKLNMALQEAWKWVSIEEYNLLLVYYLTLEGYFMICSAIQDGSRDAGELLKVGRKFFVNYLTINQSNSYLKNLGYALETVFAEMDDPETGKRLKGLFNFIFSQGKRPVTFVEVISGLHAIHEKKIPKVEELDLMYGVKSVRNDDYNVQGELKIKIDHYFSDLMKELQTAEANLDKILLVRNEFLNQNEKGKFVFPVVKEILIASLQESGLFDEKLNLEMKKIMQNAPKMLRETVAFFQNHLQLILHGQILISGSKVSVQVFLPLIFQDTVQKIASMASEFDKLFMKYPTLELSLQTYYEIAAKQDKSDEVEDRFTILIQKMIAALYDLGQNVALAIFSQHEAEKLPPAERAQLKNKANEPIKALDQGPRFIPFYGDRVADKQNIAGTSVYDAILTTAKLCYNLSLLYRHQELINFLKSEKQYKDEVERVQQKLSARRKPQTE